MVDLTYRPLSNYIKQILQAIETIEEYIGNYDFDAFNGNKLLKDGCLMQLQHIGETFIHIKKWYPDFIGDKYKETIGLRHIISHDYTGIRPHIIRNIIQSNLPKLKKELQKESKQQTT